MMKLSILVLYVLLLTLIYSSENRKRKRLVEEYGIQNIWYRNKRAKNTRCQLCQQPKASKKIFSASKTKRIRICDECFNNAKEPQKEERVLIHATADHEFIAGKIVQEKLGGRYEIEYIEGSNKGIQKIMTTKSFSKLIYEIIPSKKLCPICFYFKFNKHKCERKNCDESICASCFKQVPECAFCRLIHVGMAVKVKQNKLRNSKNKTLEKKFGKNFVEIYGIVENISFFDGNDKKDALYYVSLYTCYFWQRNEHNGIRVVALETDIPYSTFLLEAEVEILKPNEESNEMSEPELIPFVDPDFTDLELENEILTDEDLSVVNL